jgi:hypothetical protein
LFVAMLSAGHGAPTAAFGTLPSSALTAEEDYGLESIGFIVVEAAPAMGLHRIAV